MIFISVTSALKLLHDILVWKERIKNANLIFVRISGGPTLATRKRRVTAEWAVHYWFSLLTMEPLLRALSNFTLKPPSLVTPMGEKRINPQSIVICSRAGACWSRPFHPAHSEYPTLRSTINKIFPISPSKTHIDSCTHRYKTNTNAQTHKIRKLQCKIISQRNITYTGLYFCTQTFSQDQHPLLNSSKTHTHTASYYQCSEMKYGPYHWLY